MAATANCPQPKPQNVCFKDTELKQVDMAAEVLQNALRVNRSHKRNPSLKVFKHFIYLVLGKSSNVISGAAVDV